MQKSGDISTTDPTKHLCDGLQFSLSDDMKSEISHSYENLIITADYYKYYGIFAYLN